MIDRAAYQFAGRIVVFVACVVAALGLADLAAPHLPPTWSSAVLDGPDDHARLRSVGGRVLMVGDSAVRHRSKREEDKRQLFTLVANRIETELVLVSHPARALDTFLAQTRYLCSAGVEPALIIVPISLRSFSPEWESTLEYDFGRRNRMYAQPLRTRALSVFKWSFENQPWESPTAVPVWVRGREIGTLGSVLAEGAGDGSRVLAARYRVRYATDIKRSRQFGALKELAALGKREGLNLLFYVTPFNWEAMEKLVAPEDMAAVERSVGALRVRLAASGYRLKDFSRLVGADQFDHRPWNPNEHLYAGGRIALANAIGDEARRLLD